MRYVLSILLVSCWLAAPSLRAQTESEEEIAQLRARVALLEERLARIEASVTGEVESDLEVEVRRVVEVAVPPPAARSWTEGLVLDGDLRYRHETINDEAISVRHRHRMRARANATATLNEDMEVGFGLSTGGIANDSGNQSFDAGFSRKSVGVDRAYFDWSLSDTLTLLGGKMSNPFFRPGGYHLLYDGDIRPEGLALRVSSGTFFANASAFWAEERGSGPDTMWYGLQAGYRGSPARGVSLTAGASVHELSHAQGRAPVFTPDNGQGNQLDANGNYLYGFSQVEVFGELSFDLSGHPLRMFVDYVTNSAADDHADGLALGIDYRRVSDTGTWNLAWIYQDLGANAVVGAFTDSDFAGGTSDGSGYTLRAGYAFPRGWNLGLRYILGDRGEAAGNLRDYDRLQADIVFNY